jgi:hypothetical protein
MVELGFCIAKCKNKNKCFFVKDYYICGHLLCYNTAIKFRCCVLCGCNVFRYIMTDNLVEVEMSHSILNQYDFYCIRYDNNNCRIYYKNW